MDTKNPIYYFGFFAEESDKISQIDIIHQQTTRVGLVVSVLDSEPGELGSNLGAYTG
jgi:hypothetical protein